MTACRALTKCPFPTPRSAVAWCGPAAGLAIVAVLGFGATCQGAPRQDAAAEEREFHLHLRRQVPVAGLEGAIAPQTSTEVWEAGRTAVIICDMWDAHHCYNAVQRVTDMAPRMNEFIKTARAAGALIIHAPSSCMAAYEGHPARQRALDAPTAPDLPEGIDQWCTQIPAEEAGVYPLDQTDGGEDDDPQTHSKWHDTLRQMGRNPDAPWTRQIELLEIDDRDAITDSGTEVWNLLQARGIDRVMMVGVHTNMCVVGRPFGLRHLASHGKQVVLVRDLTDAMYNPASWPYVNHHSGTDLIIEHIEKYICPTVLSTDLLGGTPHRFGDDHRPRVAVVVSEFEYQTARTLPTFARQQLRTDFHLDFVVNADIDNHLLDGIEMLDHADVAVLSIWRRTPPATQLAVVRRYVQSGKPLVAIRTTSHAFVGRDPQVPPGHDAWPDFDRAVLGARYEGHYGNHADQGDPPTRLRIVDSAAEHPLLQGLGDREFITAGWLYRMRDRQEPSSLLLTGRAGPESQEEPVAWTYARPETGGQTFYTSLGHPDDFQSQLMKQLLRNAVYWASDKPVPGVLARDQ